MVITKLVAIEYNTDRLNKLLHLDRDLSSHELPSFAPSCTNLVETPGIDVGAE